MASLKGVDANDPLGRATGINLKHVFADTRGVVDFDEAEARGQLFYLDSGSCDLGKSWEGDGNKARPRGSCHDSCEALGAMSSWLEFMRLCGVLGKKRGEVVWEKNLGRGIIHSRV